jgi:hypothetical protein
MSMSGSVSSTSPQGPPGPGALTALPIAIPSSGAVQAIAGSFVPCDVRTGQVPVLTPLNPTEGTLFAVADTFGMAGAPYTVLVTAQGAGVTICNPSWNGSGSPYGAIATLQTPLAVQRWRFYALTSQWMLDN